MRRSISQRMAAAKEKMLARKRVPRVYFLGPQDFADFELTDPPKMKAPFHQGGRPTMLEVLSYEGLAVRLSKGRPARGQSRLFCCHGTTVQVPLE